MAVDAAQQMIGRNVIIEAEVVEELRRNRLTPSSLNSPQINATIKIMTPKHRQRRVFSTLSLRRGH